MHNVAERLLARRGKKVPIDDGRKISLIFLGGAMSGVRGAGALIALEEMGLSDAFDEVYAISAGFPNAAYMLTHNGKQGTSIYYEDLCKNGFINVKRVWNMIDMDYLVSVMDKEKPLDYAKLSSTDTALYVKLLNLTAKDTEYMKVNGLPPEKLRTIMKAAMSIPYLNPGATEIDGILYKDAGREKGKWISDLEHVLATDATDVVIIYNLFEQFDFIRKHGILESDRLLQIVPPNEDETTLSVCTNPEILKAKAEEMGRIMKGELGVDGGIDLRYS